MCNNNLVNYNNRTTFKLVHMKRHISVACVSQKYDLPICNHLNRCTLYTLKQLFISAILYYNAKLYSVNFLIFDRNSR